MTLSGTTYLPKLSFEQLFSCLPALTLKLPVYLSAHLAVSPWGTEPMLYSSLCLWLLAPSVWWTELTVRRFSLILPSTECLQQPLKYHPQLYELGNWLSENLPKAMPLIRNRRLNLNPGLPPLNCWEILTTKSCFFFSWLIHCISYKIYHSYESYVTRHKCVSFVVIIK